MNKKIEEILTFEVYRKKYFEIWIPVQNLINPVFSLQGNNLIISISNSNTNYKISHIPEEVIASIKNEKCLIVESLNNQKIKHLIQLEEKL